MAKHDRGILKNEQVRALQLWLKVDGFAVRDPKGEYQLFQVRIGDEWLSVCTDAKGIISTPFELREKVREFQDSLALRPLVTRKEPVKSEREVDSDLRDDFAINAPIDFDLALSVWGDRSVNFNDDSTRNCFNAVWASLRYEWADAMLEARKK